METFAKIDINTIDFSKENGLVPAVIQHYLTGKILMVGYMNLEALEATLETEKVTFFSRSKNRLWTKGESSQNYLLLHSIAHDCDADAILIQALPQGPTCHTGLESCFDTLGKPDSFLPFLEKLLQNRKESMPEGSYTSKMFGKGLDKIAQKVGEEAVETVIAAKNPDDSEFIYEASDLLFHLMLLLVEKNIPFESLLAELKKRHK